MALLKGKVLGFNSLQANGKIIKCYANRIQDTTYQPLDLSAHIDKMVEVEGYLHGAVLSQAKFSRLIQLRAECRNCVYFSEFSSSDGEKKGKCRLNPPVFFFDPLKKGMRSDFPVVKENDWCGQFQSKKTKTS
jgi:hypothetical protein